MNVSEAAVSELAGTPLKVTAVAPVRPLPRIWAVANGAPIEHKGQKRAEPHVEAEDRSKIGESAVHGRAIKHAVRDSVR
jgi:hypothetical protein